MEKQFVTEQEAFWYGDFGNSYLKRNDGQEVLASKTAKFAKVLSNISSKRSNYVELDTESLTPPRSNFPHRIWI